MNKTEKAQDELIEFMLKPMKDAIREQERQDKNKFRLFKDYTKAKKEKQCVMEYFQYGFDPDYDCGCPNCETHAAAMDIVWDKSVNISAMDALSNNGFTKKEAQNQIDIFNDLGAFTDSEINGIDPPGLKTNNK